MPCSACSWRLFKHIHSGLKIAFGEQWPLPSAPGTAACMHMACGPAQSMPLLGQATWSWISPPMQPDAVRAPFHSYRMITAIKYNPCTILKSSLTGSSLHIGQSASVGCEDVPQWPREGGPGPAGLSQAYLYNAGGVLACRAVELVLLQIGHRKEPAALAHMHSVGVALVEQPLLRPPSVGQPRLVKQVICERPAILAKATCLEKAHCLVQGGINPLQSTW